MKMRRHSEEFKNKVLSRVVKGESVREISEELKIVPSLIYQWRKKKTPLMNKTTNSNLNIRDAVIYLKHAKAAMTKELTSGKIKQLSRSNLLTLLALDSLSEGEA